MNTKIHYSFAIFVKPKQRWINYTLHPYVNREICHPRNPDIKHLSVSLITDITFIQARH